MIYLYAYTNFKKNLDSLRRIASIYWNLKEHGIHAEILLNDYRAQILAKNWGLPLATTIETIKDIDAIANINDIIVIDSPETLEGKILNYPNKFKQIIYVNSSCKKIIYKGALILNLFNDGLIFKKIKTIKKLDKTILIYGDSDYNKTILKNSEFFKNKNIDLYWGEYFFVKYEEELSKIFDTIIDSEDYYNILGKYKNVITSSTQIAIEAKLNGSKVAFFNNLEGKECNNKLESQLDIKIFDKIDTINFNNIYLFDNVILSNFNNQIYKIIKDNM